MNIWIRNNSNSPENAVGFQYVLNKKLLGDGKAEVVKYDKNVIKNFVSILINNNAFIK